MGIGIQVGDYGNEQYMRAALDLTGPFAAPPVHASARNPEEESVACAKLISTPAGC